MKSLDNLSPPLHKSANDIAWWRKRGLLEERRLLWEYTSFLHEESPVNQRLWHFVHQTKDIPKCLYCGSTGVSFYSFTRGYGKYCSMVCSHAPENKRQDNIRAKNKEKYGVEHTSMLSENREKAKSTNMLKYGVDHYAQTAECQQRMRKTTKERHGSETYRNPEKNIATKKLRYGSAAAKPFSMEVNKILYNADLLSEEIKKNGIKGTVERLGLGSVTTLYGALSRLDMPRTDKKNWLQYSLAEQLRTLDPGLSITTDTRKIIAPKELDIFLPEKKLAIELNGLYWHSSDNTGNKNETKKHLLKTEQCESLDIQLIHISDEQYLNKSDIVMSILAAKLGLLEKKIGARSCEVVLLKDNKKERTFFEDSHIQGYVPSKLCYALVSENDLVAAMSFGVPRFSKTHDWELLRYANKLNSVVAGGASRLFSQFRKDIGTGSSIISYADRSRTTTIRKTLYDNLGFSYESTTAPNYWYYKEGKLFSRIKFQKHKLSGLLEKFDPEKTEKENMLENGYRIYYDCGNIKYTKNLDSS